MSRIDGAVLPAPAAAWETPARPLGRTRIVSLLLFGVLGIFVLLTFHLHGISNDEEVQHVYGRLLVAFYRSGFADHAAFGYKNLYLYGGMFDVIAAVLEPVVRMSVWDLRHLLSAGFGLLGIVGAWRLAGLLAGERAGIVAALLLALTGAWSGGMFTHTKDVPFAACMIWALFYTVRVARRLPAPSRADVLWLGVAVGGAFGLRVGAVFAVFYLGVAVLAASWTLGGPRPAGRAKFLLRSLRALLPAGVIAFALMALFWPWSVMAPGNIVRAMTTFSRFAFPLDTVLAGKVMHIGDVPGSYLSRYLLVRLPELFLLGLALAVACAVAAVGRMPLQGEAERRRALCWLPPALAVLFPIGFTLACAPALYNGIRHFLFLLPPLAVLAASGWSWAWQASAGRAGRRWGLALVFCALAVSHLAQLVRLHPYGYVQYNRLAGHEAVAAGQWELDYWSSSLREAVTFLNAHVAAEGQPRARYTVAVCAEPVQAAAFLDPRFVVTSDWRAADFFLSTTHMGCDKVMKGRIIHEVVRDGLVLGVVRDRRELEGVERTPH